MPFRASAVTCQLRCLTFLAKPNAHEITRLCNACEVHIVNPHYTNYLLTYTRKLAFEEQDTSVPYAWYGTVLNYRVPASDRTIALTAGTEMRRTVRVPLRAKERPATAHRECQTREAGRQR